MARIALFLAVAVCVAALGARADTHAWDDDPHPVTLRDSDVFTDGYTASDAENFFNDLMVVPLNDGMLVLYAHGFVRAGIAPAAQPDAIVLSGGKKRFLYTCASGVAVGSADMDTNTPHVVLQHALDGSASATFVRDSATDSTAYVLVGDGDALLLWHVDVDEPSNNKQVGHEPLPGEARFTSVLLDDRMLWVSALPAGDGMYHFFVNGVRVDTGEALDAVPLVSGDRTAYSGLGGAGVISSEAYVTLTYPCVCVEGIGACQCTDAFEWTGGSVSALWSGVEGHTMEKTTDAILAYDDQDVVFINEDSVDIPVLSIVPLLKADGGDGLGNYLTFYSAGGASAVGLVDVRSLYVFDADVFVFAFSPQEDTWLLGVLDSNYDVKPSPLAPQCDASISTVRGEDVFFVCPQTYPSTVFRYSARTLDVANVTAVRDGLAITGLNWCGHLLVVSTSDGALYTAHLASSPPTPPNEQHMRNHGGGGKNVGIIVGVAVGGTLVAILVVAGMIAARRRRSALSTGMSGAGASAPLYQNGAVPAPYGTVHQAAPYQQQAAPYGAAYVQPPQLPGDRSYARNVVM